MQYQHPTSHALIKPGMVISLGLAMLVPAVSFAADLTAEQIMVKVSQTYCSLRSFHLVEQEETQPTYSALPMIASGDLPAPFGNRPARCTADLAVSMPGKIRLVVSSREAEILLVSDGSKTWEYIPNLNEYEEVAAAPLLQEFWAQPIPLIGDDLALYRNLPHEAGHAKLRGEETLSLDGQQVRCYAVNLLANSVWRTLWVDERRLSVLRDRWTFNPGSAPRVGYGSNAFFVNAVSRTSRVTKADLGPQSNDAFQFAVPSGTRRVDSFCAQAGLVQGAEEVLAGVLIGSEMRRVVTEEPYATGFEGSGDVDVRGTVYVLQGTKARDFTARSLQGTNVTLDSLHGKIVVLNFWASWCKPCQEELAVIQKLHEELSSKGVVFLGIDDESPETVKTFVQAGGYTFPMLLDTEHAIPQLYGVRLAPTTVVIDRKGKVTTLGIGAVGEAQLRQALTTAGLDSTKP